MRRCPESIRRQLSAAQPFVLAARNSIGRGRKGSSQTAQNAHVLAESLHRDEIIDVRDLIPSEAEIVERIETSRDQVAVNGNNWKFFEWRSPDRTLHLLAAQGSGSKTDEQDLQVFLERIRLVVLNLHPIAVWGHESDRLGRDEVGTLRLVRAIERNAKEGFPCELGYSRRGALPQHDGWDIPIFFEARQARIQAESLARRTRDAQRLQTDDRMVDGRFRISISHPLPPGLGRARLLDNRGGAGMAIGFLDSASFRPALEEVGVPLHLCVDDDGDVADQVANVRWALEEMANGRPALSIGRHLAKSGYSTTGIARRYRRGATYRSVFGEPDTRICSRMCRSITRQLEFYETGILKTTVGGESLVIQNCLPPGGWLTPDVSTGVREWIARRAVYRHKGTTPTVLNGFPVSLDGVPYRLVSVNHQCSTSAGSADD